MNSSTLYVIATPIGHLQDITLRALDTLKEVDVIACEDTRETKKLLDEYSIHTPLLSYHAQSSQSREDEIMAVLESGKTIALVSDRGTPGISDPGERLIRKAIQRGINVIPIPGASALITALQASGASTHTFTYHGFLPHKKGRQTMLLKMIDEDTQTHLFYESPHRIVKCLEQLVEFGIAQRHLIVARELTKHYEEFLRGTAQEILGTLLSREKIQGEFVVIIDSK